MTCAPELENSSVLPSAGDLATCSVASTPPAPPRFSTTISEPSRVCMSEATRRASMSTGPPAANGTTTLMVSAAAAADKASSSAIVAPHRRNIGMSSLSDRLRAIRWLAATEVVVAGQRRGPEARQFLVVGNILGDEPHRHDHFGASNDGVLAGPARQRICRP